MTETNAGMMGVEGWRRVKGGDGGGSSKVEGVEVWMEEAKGSGEYRRTKGEVEGGNTWRKVRIESRGWRVEVKDKAERRKGKYMEVEDRGRKGSVDVVQGWEGWEGGEVRGEVEWRPLDGVEMWRNDWRIIDCRERDG